MREAGSRKQMHRIVGRKKKQGQTHAAAGGGVMTVGGRAGMPAKDKSRTEKEHERNSRHK